MFDLSPDMTLEAPIWFEFDPELPVTLTQVLGDLKSQEVQIDREEVTLGNELYCMVTTTEIRTYRYFEPIKKHPRSFWGWVKHMFV